MSRKTILGIIAVLGAILAVFQKQFGLAIDSTAFVSGLSVVLLYILLEGKADLKRMGQQSGKFKDPKFLVALLTAILTALKETLWPGLPLEVVNTIIAIVMSILFGKDWKQLKKV